LIWAIRFFMTRVHTRKAQIGAFDRGSG